MLNCEEIFVRASGDLCYASLPCLSWYERFFLSLRSWRYVCMGDIEGDAYFRSSNIYTFGNVVMRWNFFFCLTIVTVQGTTRRNIRVSFARTILPMFVIIPVTVVYCTYITCVSCYVGGMQNSKAVQILSFRCICGVHAIVCVVLWYPTYCTVHYYASWRYCTTTFGFEKYKTEECKQTRESLNQLIWTSVYDLFILYRMPNGSMSDCRCTLHYTEYTRVEFYLEKSVLHRFPFPSLFFNAPHQK